MKGQGASWLHAGSGGALGNNDGVSLRQNLTLPALRTLLARNYSFTRGWLFILRTWQLKLVVDFFFPPFMGVESN